MKYISKKGDHHDFIKPPRRSLEKGVEEWMGGGGQMSGDWDEQQQICYRKSIT